MAHPSFFGAFRVVAWIVGLSLIMPSNASAQHSGGHGGRGHSSGRIGGSHGRSKQRIIPAPLRANSPSTGYDLLS